jgi:hypothetical protein
LVSVAVLFVMRLRVVLLDMGLAAVGQFAFVRAARNYFVVFDDARGSGGDAARRGSVAMNRRIRMHVHAAVDPGAIPRTIVHDHNVVAPPEMRVALSPGAEVGADGYAESETDRAANHEAGPRREIDDAWIVNGDADKRWISGLNFDVTRRAGDDDLSVGTEIAKSLAFWRMRWTASITSGRCARTALPR